MGSSIVVFCAALLVVKQSQTLSNTSHNKSVESLLSAGVNSFYNRVPSGRIINRLSKDVGKIDGTLIESLQMLYLLLFVTVGNIAMCLYSSSIYTLLPLALVFYFSAKLKQFYMKTKI
jgi:ATP-binding cassette subfamily C (CFTR/MRP) protein 1